MVPLLLQFSPGGRSKKLFTIISWFPTRTHLRKHRRKAAHITRGYTNNQITRYTHVKLGMHRGIGFGTLVGLRRVVVHDLCGLINKWTDIAMRRINLHYFRTCVLYQSLGKGGELYNYSCVLHRGRSRHMTRNQSGDVWGVECGGIRSNRAHAFWVNARVAPLLARTCRRRIGIGLRWVLIKIIIYGPKRIRWVNTSGYVLKVSSFCTECVLRVLSTTVRILIDTNPHEWVPHIRNELY